MAAKASPKEALPVPEEDPTLGPKVTRVYNEIWASTLDSIAFVSESLLSTDEDTNTITLNLIDHIIKPENWNPNLSYNVLSATCFFFASRITGHHRNTTDRIASAMKVDLSLIEAMAGPQVHYNPVVKLRLMEALRVGAEDVKKGYAILYEHREGLKEFVGEYADRLDVLPSPDNVDKIDVQKVMGNMGWKEGESLGSKREGIVSPIKATQRPPRAGLGFGSRLDEATEATRTGVPSEQAVIEEEKASDAELDDSELDEFDRFVEGDE